MHALGVILEDISLRDIIHPVYRRPLAVAFPTHKWNVDLICARFLIAWRKDLVLAVAFRTGGRIHETFLQCLAMNARVKIFLGIGMAITALDSGQVFGMGKVFYICVFVAVNAVKFSMYRFVQNIYINIDRYVFPHALSCDVGIRMAIQTITIRLGLKDRNTEKRQPEED